MHAYVSMQRVINPVNSTLSYLSYLLQDFDAVVICNGHYSEPNLPDVPGADQWPGLQMHSHNYRTPEPFAGQTVVVVGASNSGERQYDIPGPAICCGA